VFGRYLGIAVGSLAAIGALLEIPAYPLWSLAVFALSLWIIYGLTLAGPEDPWGEAPASAGPTLARAPRPPMEGRSESLRKGRRRSFRISRFSSGRCAIARSRPGLLGAIFG
jgi:hypothetical protein